MSEHSKYSASAFEAHALCPGRAVMERGLPDNGSKYADEGTAAHKVLEWALDSDRPAAAFVGRVVPIGGKDWPVTEEMAAAVQTALDNVGQIAGDGLVMSETRVYYHQALGVLAKEGFGTADVIATRGDELQVHDYKHGMGVPVDADDNVQLKLYALGALAEVEDTLGPFETVRLVIHQPRIKGAPSEWTCTVDELKAWIPEARRAVEERNGAERMRTGIELTPEQWEQIYLRPNDTSCRFCKAKATCPALGGVVTDTLGIKAATADEFESASIECQPQDQDDEWLSVFMGKADLIETWLKAVRAEVERRLLAGTAVPGYKIVQGKRGHRAWADKADAEAQLKAMRLKVEEMYDLSLISPTSAEKLAKAKTIGPRQWTKLQTLITQSEGKAHVAPSSDPRPAIAVTPPADEFEPAPASVEDFA